MSDRPLSIFGTTQAAWNMPQSQTTSSPLKRPPIGSPLSTTLYAQPTVARPPLLLSKNSSSSSLGGLEQNIPPKNIPPFQAFLLTTPPLKHDPDKPLPPTPSQIPAAVDDYDTSFRRRSSSVYSRTPSYWAAESIESWQTNDLEEISRTVLPPIAYSVSVPDFKSQDAAPAFLQPRKFSPLLTSPRMSIQTISSSNPSSGATTITTPPTPTMLSSTEAPRQKPAMISLHEAKETLHAPGAKILLPEELRAQAGRKNTRESQGHVRLSSSDIFRMHAPPEAPVVATLVDRQGRVRSITTPPATISQFLDDSFPPLDNRLPSVNAFPVGSGPAREMLPPTPTVAEHFFQQQMNGIDSDERGRVRERGRASLDVSKYKFPASPETYVHDPYRFQMGDKPTNTAEEYHTLLAQTYQKPSPATSEYDSDDSIRRHMKMIPQPLFSGKQPPARKSGALQGSDSSRYGRSSQSSMSSRGSNSFNLRLSMSPTGSRRTSGGSGSGFGDIPISPPRQDIHSPQSISVGSKGAARPVESHRYHRDSRFESKYYPQPLQRADRTASIEQKQKKNQKKSKNKSRPSFSVTSRPVGASSHRQNPSKNSTDSPMTSPTLGTGYAAVLNPPGAPLLTKSVIEMKLKTPLSSPQPSPLGSNPSTPEPQSSISGHGNLPLDESPVLGNKKHFLQRVAMKSMRRANHKDNNHDDDHNNDNNGEVRGGEGRRQSRNQFPTTTTTTTTDPLHFNRDISPFSKPTTPPPNPSPHSPHLYPRNSISITSSSPSTKTSTKPSMKKLELPPHLGWSNDKKFEFDSATTPPPSTPVSARSRINLLMTPSRSSPGDHEQEWERGFAAVRHGREGEEEDEDEESSPTTTTGGGDSWRRKGSLFGNVRDRFVESKAQRRREDLKKMIRVVPNQGPVAESNGDGKVDRKASVTAPEGRRMSIFSRRLSEFNWV